MRNIAFELGVHGIKANVVSSGLLKTMDTSAVTTLEVFDLIAQSTSLKKVTIPQDVANYSRLLIIGKCKWYYGQNFTIDGGFTINLI